MKKWFIYVSDHHEGPFTVEEIRQGVSEGKFPAQGFVWAQGMADWLPMASVAEFASPAAPPPLAEPIAPVATESVTASTVVETRGITASTIVETRGMTASTVVETQPLDEVKTASHVAPIETSPTLTGPRHFDSEEPTGSVAQPIPEANTTTTVVEVSEQGKVQSATGRVFEAQSAQPAAAIQLDPYSPGAVANAAAAEALAAAQKAPQKKSGRGKSLLALVIVVGAVYGLAKAGFLRPLEEKITSALVSIPALPDITPEEHADLVAAAKAPLSSGPAIAVAVSRADPLSPSFYVASNLPDGTRFELYIEGVGHTLLNTLSYSGKTEATTTKHLGKTPGYRAEGGSVVPRGEYRIFVVEALSNQPPNTVEELKRLTPVSRGNLPPAVPKDRVIVFEKSVFLGQKDATYTTRLKEFHDRLADKSRNELSELKQFVALIENQFATTQATFDRLKKQRLGPVQIRAWKQMDSNWLRLDDQLSQALRKLTPEAMATDYIYGNVYALVKEVQKRLNQIHVFQSTYFDRTSSLAEAEEQSSQLVPQYQAAMTQLKEAIATIEKQPLDENGLPKPVTLPKSAAGES